MIKIAEKRLMKILKIDSKTHSNFLSMSINLFFKDINEFVDDWKKFNETSLPEQEFWKNMEDITDSDYNHAKGISKDFEIKNLSEYHDLFLKSDALLLLMFLKTLEKFR